MSFDFLHCAQNLADYGLETVLWTPGRGTGNDKRQIGGGRARPLVRIASNGLEKFRATFPNADGIIVGGLDGQGTRVPAQSVIRPAVEKDRNVPDLDFIVAQLKRMAGIEATIAPAPEVVVQNVSDDVLVAEFARRRGITVDEAKVLLA